MLFKFLEYVKPTAYFTLKNKNGVYIYPVYKKLTQDIKNQIHIDTGYQSMLAQELDASYQAVERGYIGDAPKINHIAEIPIADEYRFLKKYFSTFWYIHTFIIRLLSFHNPFKEISAFINAYKTPKFNVAKSPIINKEWSSFDSNLMHRAPKVSVIIPTLNRYIYLKDVLEDLEKQDYTNFDVIIVDQSEPFQKEFYSRFNLDLKLIHQTEKALWLARNTAIEISDADYLLFYDDDSRVDSNWISMHLKCLDFFKADISSGISISAIGDKIPEDYSYPKYSSQLDTGNVLIKRAVFNAIGLFDRQFEKQRMGDGEFGLRAYIQGFKNISNPMAKRLHLKVGTGGLREMGLWDGFRPNTWFDPRPIPSVLYLFRKYYGNKMARYSLLIMIPKSLVPYKYKGNKKIELLGYLSLLLLWPLLSIQIIKSWKLATVKLKQGIL